MSQYKIQFEQMKFPEEIEAVKKAWSEGLPLEKLQEKQKEDYNRLLKVLLIIEARFNSADPELYPTSIWQNLKNRLTNIRTHGINFRQSKEPGYIQNANNEADALLNEYRVQQCNSSSENTESLSIAVTTFADTVGEQLHELAGKRAAIEKQVADLTQKLTALESKSTTADQTIQNQSQRLDAAIAEHQKQFSAAQEQRSKGFSETQKEQASKFAHFVDASKADYSKSASTFIDEHATTLKKVDCDAADALKRVSEIEEKVKRIFNVVGNVSISGDYKNTAERERSAADLLRWISFGLMVLMGAIGTITFVHSLTHPEVDWKLFGFRLGTTLIIALPALYLAQESAKHRHRENANRKLHLELAAIDAYLELLPDSEKQKIKGGLTDKFFGKAEVQSKDDVVTQHQLFNLVADVVKNLTKGK